MVSMDVDTALGVVPDATRLGQIVDTYHRLPFERAANPAQLRDWVCLSGGDGDGDPAVCAVGVEDQGDVDDVAGVEAVAGGDLHRISLEHMDRA
jgi:hypothetical protein